MTLAGKRILLGVSGGISAYKAVELLRLLTKAGAVVDVAMTPNATRFVGVETFRALSGRPVLVDLFDEASGRGTGRVMPHLEPAEAAQLAIVAPATANVLAKLAHGIADNALLTALLSVTAPVLVAPAMDSDMWRHPATQANVELLKSRGVHVVGPVSGELARRNVGPGRLADPEEIFRAAETILAQRELAKLLAGRRVLVTAGGTREPLDPVRYIGNRSSGKMGYAIARAAAAAGADVVLITAPTWLVPPGGCEVVKVETALEMHREVISRAAECDAVVMAAAVSDFRAEQVQGEKVKKGDKDRWTVTLVPNPDIAGEVGAQKRPGQILVAFAAETERLLENAAAKLKAKNADLVVANDVSREGIGFDADDNQVTLLYKDGREEPLPK
ncbi:MAG: bifunctional phosphopantothenoylcysteine decarboxylase/phosphopantothenate--cysteine ligase CoaBC, partial [Clostridia bacterium]